MITIPFDKIDTKEGIRTFIDWLLADVGICYHPDTNFEEYYDDEGNPFFTESECMKLNELNEQCIKFCQEKHLIIYIIAMNAIDDYRKRRNLPIIDWLS